MKPDDQAALGQLLSDLEQHLLHLKEENVRTIEVAPENLRPLPGVSAAPATPVRTAPAAPPPVARPAPRPTPAPVVMTPPKPVEQAVARTASGDAETVLKDVAARISVCTKCGLCKTRNRTVPGHGHPRAEILFIGEGPGTEEDKQGLPFVGRAGQLLTRLITRMGFTRDQVFIANIVKCRPTEDGAGIKDRPPTPEEMAACIPYLKEQIAAIHPKVIVALGSTSVKGLFGDKMPGITRLRGTWLTYEGIDAMPTFHPSFLLRNGGDGGSGNNQAFWDVWHDMEAVLKKLGREAPPKG